MPRPNYGPEAKKRTSSFFSILVDYANDALDCDDGALSALRPQIQTHWQSETRLVVRTKVRFLEALVKLVDQPLTADQIKEALKRLTDYLDILEDNRPHRGGSETWHFTLNLWYKRFDRDANLQRFVTEWETRRPQKSRQVTPSTEAIPLLDEWSQLCRHSLEAQNYHRLTTNPLTVSEGVTFELEQIYVPLGLVERQLTSPNIPAKTGSLLEAEDNETQFSLDEFLESLLSGQQKRVAIVGEPGAGKTTLLQKIAVWLQEQRVLPIWISLADLQGETLEQYLLQTWLKTATCKISVNAEMQAALAEQFTQGRVWLLLDAVDEMSADGSVALTAIARQLRGWVSNAHVVLTCRLNVWDASKNALETFETYRNLTFSYGDAGNKDQVGEFIQRWFVNHPALGGFLRAELDKPERQRLQDGVKNPLRLALLCRIWSLQGTLPNTKAALYQQFTQTLYEWKQDRFPTTLAERLRLNQVLGKLALAALAQEDSKFRIRDSLIHREMGQDLELLTVALQLGWLNQVGSENGCEKVYAFYHSTFQEYFAAQALTDWHFFLSPTPPFPHSPTPPIFSPHWREVILLWLGRVEIPKTQKEEFIQALLQFKDGCGGYYNYQAYLLAAVGCAEFPECTKTEEIIAQLIEWRFAMLNQKHRYYAFYPTPITEGARVALLQTDRAKAISGLEKFVQTTPDLFARWNAASTLGRTLSPGNAIAITALSQLIDSVDSEFLQVQISDTLGKVDPGNSQASATLTKIIHSTPQTILRRKAAYTLGKIFPGSSLAISTLIDIIQSHVDPSVQLQASDNLAQIDPGNPAIISIQRQKIADHKRRRVKLSTQVEREKAIAALEQRLASTQDPATQRRCAHQLGKLHPGHPNSVEILLQLLQSSQSAKFSKRIVDCLKEILVDEQLAAIVMTLKKYSLNDACDNIHQAHECYKLLWYCTQRMTYSRFYHSWQCFLE